MEIELIRNQNRNYVSIRLQEGQFYAHERSMLAYNQIPGFLPVNIRYVDELVHVEYSLLGMQSLSAYFVHRRFSEEQIIWLVRSLFDVQTQLLEYMLSPDGLILDPDYVFLDADEMRMRFCYRPGERGTVEKNVQSLLQYILDHVDFNDQRAVTLAYGLYHLEHGGGDVLNTLKGYIEKRTGSILGQGGFDKNSGEEQEEEDEIAGGKDCSREEGCSISSRQGLLRRFFRRKSKRELLLADKAYIHGQ